MMLVALNIKEKMRRADEGHYCSGQTKSCNLWLVLIPLLIYKNQSLPVALIKLKKTFNLCNHDGFPQDSKEMHEGSGEQPSLPIHTLIILFLCI